MTLWSNLTFLLLLLQIILLSTMRKNMQIRNINVPVKSCQIELMRVI